MTVGVASLPVTTAVAEMTMVDPELELPLAETDEFALEEAEIEAGIDVDEAEKEVVKFELVEGEVGPIGEVVLP